MLDIRALLGKKGTLLDKRRDWPASDSGSRALWKVVIVGGYLVDESSEFRPQTCRLLLLTESGELLDAAYHEVRLSKDVTAELWAPYRARA
jgi:hypothetical protein